MKSRTAAGKEDKKRKVKSESDMCGEIEKE